MGNNKKDKDKKNTAPISAGISNDQLGENAGIDPKLEKRSNSSKTQFNKK